MASQRRFSTVDEPIEPADGAQLFLRCWRPDGVLANLAIVHDLGADGGRYGSFAGELAKRGIASHVVDPRGFGRSPTPVQGPPDIHLLDVQAMVMHIRTHDPLVPLFILGHGVGAFVACTYALAHQDDLNGVICEGIVLPRSRGIPLLESSRAFSRRAPWPWIARNRLSGPGPLRREPLGGLCLPLLLLHGTQDTRAPLSGSEYVHRHANSSDRTLQVFEAGGHELVNGPDPAPVRNRILLWIEAQLVSGGLRRHIGVEYINQ